MLLEHLLTVLFRFRLRIHKEIEWNNHKRMEMNGMYLSKRMESI